MNFWGVLVGRETTLDDAEENLGKPDEAEADDLRYHVSRCAMRWILSYRMSRSNNTQIAQVRLILILAIALEVTTSKPGWGILVAIARAFGIQLPQ